MNTFKVGDQVILVKDVYDLVDNTDSYGYTFKLGDCFEVVNLMSMPNDKWIVKGKVCLEDLEGLEEFFVVKAKEEMKKSALDVQEGGGHYKSKGIQPVEYAYRNNLGFIESNVVKYVSRWKEKNGIQDLKKARHYLDILIEFEEQKEQK